MQQSQRVEHKYTYGTNVWKVEVEQTGPNEFLMIDRFDVVSKKGEPYSLKKVPVQLFNEFGTEAFWNELEPYAKESMDRFISERNA